MQAAHVAAPAQGIVVLVEGGTARGDARAGPDHAVAERRALPAFAHLGLADRSRHRANIPAQGGREIGRRPIGGHDRARRHPGRRGRPPDADLPRRQSDRRRLRRALRRHDARRAARAGVPARRPRRGRPRAARRVGARAAAQGARDRRPGARVDARLPLIVLSGRAGETDRVRGFERGCDDFVSKPFAYGELRLRVAALLRRARERRSEGRLRVGELDLDPVAREVRLRGARVRLSQKEFALLRRLAAEPTRVFTKAELLRDVWGFRAFGATRTLDSHACRLRQKLSVHGGGYVVNVWGVGYRLVDGEVPEAAADATGRALEAS